MVNGTFTCVLGGVKGHVSSAYMQRKKEKDKCKKEKERSHLTFCIHYKCVLLKHTHTHTGIIMILPVCPVLVLWSEADWPSGMPCCLVWCRLEIIVERSVSRLQHTKYTHTNTQRKESTIKSNEQKKWTSSKPKSVCKQQHSAFILFHIRLTTEILHTDRPALYKMHIFTQTQQQQVAVLSTGS